VQQSKFVRRDRRTTTYGAIEQPARCTVDAIIRAAALMACADGKPVAQERTTLAGVLRNHGLLELHGEQALLSTYDEAISHRHTDGEWDAAFEHLAALAGNHGAVIAGVTVAHVAVADGVLWPQEVALLRILRDRLGIGTLSKR
jgi:tellurite resistance protein